METQQWIENLAAQARNEAIPEIHVVAPRLQPAVYRLPRFVLSLSAASSLAAACLLLVLGLHAQSVSTTPTTTQNLQAADTTQTALFAPLKMGVN
jgi:hypothetical protein